MAPGLDYSNKCLHKVFKLVHIKSTPNELILLNFYVTCHHFNTGICLEPGRSAVFSEPPSQSQLLCMGSQNCSVVSKQAQNIGISIRIG